LHSFYKKLSRSTISRTAVITIEQVLRFRFGTGLSKLEYRLM